MKGIKQPNGTYKYPGVSEADIQRQILDWLKLSRIFHFRLNVGAQKFGDRFVRFGFVGLPDIVCIVSNRLVNPGMGQFVALEIKGPNGELSRSQVDVGEQIKRAGGRYFVIHSLDEAQLAIAEVRGAK